MSDVWDVAVRGEEIPDVAKLLGRAGVFRPVELGDDEVFLADNPSGEVLDFDAFAATELRESIGAAFANDEVHFGNAVLMDEVEHRLVSDRIANGFGRNVVVWREDGHDFRGVGCSQGDDEVYVPGHSGLGIEVHRHRTGQHELEPSRIKAAGDVPDDIEFIPHGGSGYAGT